MAFDAARGIIRNFTDMKKLIVICLLLFVGCTFNAVPVLTNSTVHAQTSCLPPPPFPEVRYVVDDGSDRPFKIINGGALYTCDAHLEDSPVTGILFHDPYDGAAQLVEGVTGSSLRR